MSPAVSLPEASRGPSLAITFVHPTAFWDLSQKTGFFAGQKLMTWSILEFFEVIES